MKFDAEKLNRLFEESSKADLPDKVINAQTKSYRHSKSMEGKNPWNKGKKMPAEVGQKISEAVTGRTAWNKGKKMSEDFIEANRLAQTGKKQSIETIEKRRQKLKGVPKPPVTDAHRKALSDAHLGQKAWNKGVSSSEEAKKKNAAAQVGRKWFNNGEVAVRAYECPRGFVPGRVK